ncbi:ABC transporter substrate-binding protein [Flavihumibacter sp. R14]|nr:ABC transporter substrate-binding protein [Flavihumibacter soli]
MSINFRKNFLVTLLFLISLSYSNASYGQLVKVRLQLKWTHQFQFAGYYAAQLKGYYREEGLDIRILEGSKDISPIQMVTSGKAEFGIYDPEILIKSPKDNPLTAVFATLQSSPYGVLSRPESGIRRPSDLVGKRVLSAGDQGWSIFKAIMLKEGIATDKTQIIPRHKDSEELIDQTADAVITYYTSQPTRLRNLGVDPAIMKPLDYGVDFYGDVVFTSRKFAEESPEVVEAFNRATRRGWEYALSHKVKMADHILGLPNVKQHGITKQNLLDEAKELEKLILPKFVPIGHMNAGRWQNMLSIYQELGLADQSLTLEGFLFSPDETGDGGWYDILIYTLMIGGLLFIIAIVLNWELRRQVMTKTSALISENEERRKADERLELAIEAAGLGLWELNLNNKTAHLNQRWILNQLGYDWDDTSKDLSKWDSLVHPEDKGRVEKVNKDFLASSTSSNTISYRVKTSDGDWRWILSFRKISGRDESGRPTNITGLHLDIDSIKRKEFELQQLTKELLKKNGELEKFAYITSHNLRAPVVNLKSLTEMHAAGDLPAELEVEINSKIRQSVKQLDNTLNDLVEIVSSKSGEQISRESLNLMIELDQVMVSIENQIQSSGAFIETDFTEVEHINFPKRYLTSILLNLLTNAIKYRSPDRPLIISVKTYIDKDFTVLSFSDNGIGINMQKFGHKVFGLYQRFHNNIDGKGLGLYIIKSQVEAMDGKIEVESTENEGTTFNISFYDPHHQSAELSVSAK